MKYKSTRNSNISYTSAQAMAQGISPEGGLFVPESFPNLQNRFAELAKCDYIGRAKAILGLYLTDFTAAEIEDCVTAAYAPQKFENDCPAKLVELRPGVNLLELWHGPTCAFKDMALQLLPHLLTKSLQKCGGDKKAVILVATSGDTGKAALEGFRDVPGTQILVFYPDKGVSAMQLRQMNTQEGENVCVCAVEGNFDDCQTRVKEIFTNDSIKATLSEAGLVFSSANSINWGRLLPQIIYYFSAYFDLYNCGKIGSFEEKINIVVPTGNFGNILAAYYAMRMGLPVGKLICASNANHVLTDFIATGIYDKERAFHTTLSPSMDILVSSNLERLLYHLCDENSDQLSAWMQALSAQGSYTVNAATTERIKTLFAAGTCNDAQTLQTIRETFEKEHYLLDTHTAVAVSVYNDYLQQSGDATVTVIASTASPYKFAPSVLGALQKTEETDEFRITELLASYTETVVPPQLMALMHTPLRFDNRVNKTEIAEFVLRNVGVLV